MNYGKNKEDTGVGIKEKIAIIFLLVAMSFNSPNPSGKHSVHVANQQQEKVQIEKSVDEDTEVNTVVMN